MSDPRLFLAVSLDPTLRQGLASFARELCQPVREWRLVTAENLHLTLRFLGTLPTPLIAQLETGLSQPVGSCLGGTFQVVGTGAFPRSARARVVWAGLSGPLERLTRLVDVIDQGLQAIGLQRDPAEYRAHITLARARTERGIDLGTRLDPKAEFGALSVDRIELFESQLSGGPPRYQRRWSLPLAPDTQDV